MALVRPFAGVSPRIGQGCFLAPNATVIGDVVLAERVSIWYNCVLRADVGQIRIGAETNIQDGSVLHMTTDHSHTIIGDAVTVGHGAVIHGAIVGDGALIGMGAILMDNARVGEEAIVAAGALLPPGMEIPAGCLAMGRPARVKRELRGDERRKGREGAERYLALAAAHRS